MSDTSFNNMKHIISALVVLVLFSSCSGPNRLTRSLNKYNTNLSYLHDSEIINCDKSNTLTISGFNNKLLDSLTYASKSSRTFIPLIILFYSELNMEANLGQRSLNSRYSDFFINSFATESARTGCYTFTQDNAEYDIELTFDKCETVSQYNKTSFFAYLFFFWFYSEGHKASQGTSTLELNVKLRKGNSLILSKNYLFKDIEPFLYTPQGTITHEALVINMAESLSNATKNCIEKVIEDVNTAIANQ